MINVGIHYRVKPGRERDFEEAFGRVVEFLRSRPGVIEARLYRNVNDPREYLVYSEWTDLDSFREFVSSQAYRETTQYGREILEGRPVHRVLVEEKSEPHER
jgi:heme-degrading monooxygenase HmoA